MSDSGVFKRRTTHESRLVYAASTALVVAGWASTVWPTVPGVIFGVLVLRFALVALYRRAERRRIARAVAEQAAWEQRRPRYDQVSEVFQDVHPEPCVSVVDADRDAA